MKTLKKSLVLVLALMMAVGVLAIGANAAYTDAKDIAPEYKEAIDVLSSVGVLVGNGDGTLTPENPITRAELAKILYEANTGKNYLTASNYAGVGTFADVPEDEWYAGVVYYAAHEGWILGYGDGNFGPNDNVIGHDAITMILRAIGYGAYGEIADGATYVAEAIKIADELGLLVNTDANDVDYYVAGARQEVFEYLYQAMLVPTFVATSEDTDHYDPAFIEGPGIQGYDDVASLFEQRHETIRNANDVVLAVPATDPVALIATNGALSVLLDNANELTTYEEVSADLLGHYCHYVTVNGKIAHIRALSIEVTLPHSTAAELTAKKLKIGEVSGGAYTVVDGIVDEKFLNEIPDDAKENTVLCGGTYYVYDGTIFTRKLTNDLYATVVVESYLDSDKVMQYTINGTTKTAAKWAKEEAVYGLETITKESNDNGFLCLADIYGKTATISVLNPVDTGKITEVDYEDFVEKVSFRLNGKTYLTYDAVAHLWAGEETLVNFNWSNLYNEVKHSQQDEVKDIYAFDGEIAVLAPAGFYGEKIYPTPIDFDGFMKVGSAQAKFTYTPAVKDNIFTSVDESAPAKFEIEYATVLGFTDDAVVGPIDLTVEYDSTGAYVLNPNGGKTYIYEASDFANVREKTTRTVDLWGKKGEDAKVIRPFAIADDGSITILTFDAINANRDVEYYTLEADRLKNVIATGETTVHASNNKGYYAKDAKFVGYDVANDKFVSVKGSANIPDDELVYTDLVLINDAGEYDDVIVVFGGYFWDKPEMVGLVWVDASSYTSVMIDEAPGVKYIYTGVDVYGNEVTLTLTDDVRLRTGGFFVYDDKYEIAEELRVPAGDGEGTAQINDEGYIYLRGTWVDLDEFTISGTPANGKTFMVLYNWFTEETELWFDVLPEDIALG